MEAMQQISATRTHGNTYSFIHEKTGAEIALITGKRRARALLLELRANKATQSWQQYADLAKTWRAANPR